MTSITLDSVSLRFKNTYGKEKSLRAELFKYLKKDLKFEYFSSLKNINLKLNSGDKLGILGPNGSGKSSLLRIISSIYTPTEGLIKINGNVLSVISNNSGIDLESTGIENIYQICYMRNYSTKQIEEKLMEIISFSELGPTIYKPARTYSSGMLIRLTVSILLNLDSDILILDEFISTGDHDFGKKVRSKIIEKIDKSKIFLLASHNYELVNQLCNKKIFLEKGEIIKKEF